MKLPFSYSFFYENIFFLLLENDSNTPWMKLNKKSLISCNARAYIKQPDGKMILITGIWWLEKYKQSYSLHNIPDYTGNVTKYDVSWIYLWHIICSLLYYMHLNTGKYNKSWSQLDIHLSMIIPNNMNMLLKTPFYLMYLVVLLWYVFHEIDVTEMMEKMIDHYQFRMR